MLFKNRIKKVVDIMKTEMKLPERDSIKLEKGDLTAMILAAAVVVGPIVIGLIILMYLVGWLFGAFR